MTDKVVQVQNLGKRYRIGVQEESPEGLRETIVALAGASFRYLREMSRPPTEVETLWALRNISFDVNQGEMVGIIGRNGAGKSTLLKILSRITGPTEGQAVIAGRVGSLLEVGTGFHPELTGRENVYLNGAILGMKIREINRKFDEIVSFAEIEKFIDTPVKRYSSGMYVRLAFAVAAHLEPEILIVDEVLAVGDANFQRKCLGKMEGVASEGRTVLFVSHNMQAIARMCSRVITLQEGTIVYEGGPTEAIAKYFSGIHSTAEKTWYGDLAHAPGDDDVRLLGIRVRGPEGGPKETLQYRQPVFIDIDYEIRNPIQNLATSIDLMNGDGVLIFGSGDQKYGEFDVRSPGYYRSTCVIPPCLLAESTFFVRVALLESASSVIKHVTVRDALAFQIIDSPDETSAFGWIISNHPGVIKPQLEWRVTFNPTSAVFDSFGLQNAESAYSADIRH